MGDSHELRLSESSFTSFSCRWTLEEFSSLDSACGQEYKSSTFGSKGGSDLFYLTIYPGGETEENAGDVSCFLLCLASPDSGGIGVKFELSLCDENGRVVKTASVEETEILSSGTRSGFSNLIDKEELIQNLPEDVLVVCLKGTWCSSSYTIRRQTKYSPDLTCPYTCLSEDLANLLGDAKSSDVRFDVLDDIGYAQQKKRLKLDPSQEAEPSEDATMTAHSAILAARSKFFEWIFTKDDGPKSGSPEQRRFSIDCNDTDSINSMLEFFYTGQVGPLTTEALCELFLTAVDFRLDDLKSQCSNVLVSRIDDKSASILLELALTHGEETLKDRIVEFFGKEWKSIDFENHEHVLEKYPEILFEIVAAADFE